MNARWAYIERLLREAEVDFYEAQRPGWFCRPFSPEEIASHPGRDRIEATVRAAAEELVRRVLRDAFAED
jgi:hypothetical protein